MKPIAGPRLSIGPDARLVRMWDRQVVIRRARIRCDYGTIEIVDTTANQPVADIADAVLALTRVADGHQRLDFEPMRLGDLDTAVVVIAVGALFDADQNTRIGGLEAAQQPTESRTAHRCSLFRGEQLSFDEATQAKLDAEPNLQIGQAVHHLNHALADVQFVIIEQATAEVHDRGVGHRLPAAIARSEWGWR